MRPLTVRAPRGRPGRRPGGSSGRRRPVHAGRLDVASILRTCSLSDQRRESAREAARGRWPWPLGIGVAFAIMGLVSWHRTRTASDVQQYGPRPWINSPWTILVATVAGVVLGLVIQLVLRSADHDEHDQVREKGDGLSSS